MITRNELKKIKSLKLKKNRKLYSLFIAEGKKTVFELYDSNFVVHGIYSVNKIKDLDSIIISESKMSELTFLKNPSTVFGVFKLPSKPEINMKGFVLAVDGLSDPGNLGNIIRLCDWFGIQTLLCSESTVDCFSPKVVQSTMGSLSRVNCVYGDLESFIEISDKKIYGAVLKDGDSIYSNKFKFDSVLVLGSESHGISKKILNKIDSKITIPKYSKSIGPESLNVASAASIIISQFFMNTD